MSLPSRLILPRHLWQTMLDHVMACVPEEACGILAGTQGRVSQVRPIENVERSRFRFRMEPQAQVDALLEIEAQGLELLAIYHSHPSGPPGPSATDLAEAFYPEAAAVIWCCDYRGWHARAFDLGGPVPMEIEILPAP